MFITVGLGGVYIANALMIFYTLHRQRRGLLASQCSAVEVIATGVIISLGVLLTGIGKLAGHILGGLVMAIGTLVICTGTVFLLILYTKRRGQDPPETDVSEDIPDPPIGYVRCSPRHRDFRSWKPVRRPCRTPTAVV